VCVITNEKLIGGTCSALCCAVQEVEKAGAPIVNERVADVRKTKNMVWRRVAGGWKGMRM
jgi:hypothetical protein